MVEEKFIWCRNCDAVHHISRFDKAPRYEYVAGEFQEILADDWRVFIRRHDGHRLEPLQSVSEKFYPNGAINDPMSTAYIEVTNGRESLLLQQKRTSIAEPLRFEPVSGRLVDLGIALEVQESQILKEMRSHFRWSGEPLDDDKMSLFIRLFKDVVKDINPEQVEIGGFSAGDDNVCFGLLASHYVDVLVDRCATHFAPVELADIRRFVNLHRYGCDVMALVMRRQSIFEQRAL